MKFHHPNKILRCSKHTVQNFVKLKRKRVGQFLIKKHPVASNKIFLRPFSRPFGAPLVVAAREIGQMAQGEGWYFVAAKGHY